MKSYFKILLVLLLSLAITIFLSPILASILPFHLYKISSRLALITSFIMLYYFKDYLGFSSIKSLGFNINSKWWIQLLFGLSLAVISIGIIILCMLYFYIRYPVPDISYILWIQHISSYLTAGLIVAVIEEMFFRGFILQSLLKDTRIITSIIITNLFYSSVHFLKPVDSPAIKTLNLITSLKSVPVFFNPLLSNWTANWPSFLGLFLVGIVLSLAYVKTRSLALSVGLHAGWILGIKSISFGTDTTIAGFLWTNGNVLKNPISWFLMVIFIIILSYRPKK